MSQENVQIISAADFMPVPIPEPSSPYTRNCGCVYQEIVTNVASDLTWVDLTDTLVTPCAAHEQQHHMPAEPGISDT